MKQSEVKKLNKSELQELCASYELKFEDSYTKNELIQLLTETGHIEEAEEAASNDAENPETELNEEFEQSEEEVAEQDELALKLEPATSTEVIEEKQCPFEALQQEGFALISKIKALSNERKKISKPTARLDAAVSQIERLIRNNFIK